MTNRDPQSRQAAAPSVNIRTRKFIGMLALLALIIIYCLGAMLVAVHYVLDKHGILQAVYFIVAGVTWLPPAMVLIKWMQRPDDPGN